MHASSSHRRPALLAITLWAVLVGGLAPSVAAIVAPDARHAVEQPATIGTNSCQGTLACQGVVGSVGDNSCNGTQACQDAQGNIGNNSCVGNQACQEAGGNVGNNSCVGNQACQEAGGNVGNNSCSGGAACQGVTGDVGDCENNTVTPAECAQPDGRIKRSGGPLWGNNIYNTTAAGQAVSLKIYAGHVRRVYISIQNDSDVDASFNVCQCVGTQGSQTGFTFTYFVNRGSANITSAVEAGTFTTPTLAPGEAFVIRARVAVSSAATRGSPVARLYTLTSGSGTEEDAVAIWVQRK